MKIVLLCVPLIAEAFLHFSHSFACSIKIFTQNFFKNQKLVKNKLKLYTFLTIRKLSIMNAVCIDFQFTIHLFIRYELKKIFLFKLFSPVILSSYS